VKRGNVEMTSFCFFLFFCLCTSSNHNITSITTSQQAQHSIKHNIPSYQAQHPILSSTTSHQSQIMWLHSAKCDPIGSNYIMQ
jgi:hypothetical protein